MTRDWNREKLILARRSAGETFTSIGAAFGIKRQRAHAIWKRNQPQPLATTEYTGARVQTQDTAETT